MIVFKLERERPAFATHGSQLYYIKERYIRGFDFSTQRDNPLVAIRRNPSAAYNQGGCQLWALGWAGLGCWRGRWLRGVPWLLLTAGVSQEARTRGACCPAWSLLFR